MPFYKKKGYTAGSQGTTDQFNEQASEILYEGQIDLGNGNYQVDIFLTHKK